MTAHLQRPFAVFGSVCFALLLCLNAGVSDARAVEIDTGSPFVDARYTKTVSMDFQDAPLVDVLKMFSQQSGLNLIASTELQDKTVTVFLDKVSVEEALQYVLKANGLTYEIQPESNIYLVKPMPKPETEVITRVYHLKHATVSTSKLNQTYIIKPAGSEEDEETTTVTEEEEAGLEAAVKAVLTEYGRVVTDPRTNSITVTDIAANFANIEETIARLDVPVPQVLIEVEMLEVAKNLTDKLGVKFGNTLFTVTGATRRHLYPWNQNDILQRGLNFGDLTSGDPEYTVGVMDASVFSAALEFLKTDTRTKSLARPRILTLNNQPAEIKIAANEAIGIASSTISSEGVSTAAVEAERVETGVFLTVTPQVNVVTDEITLAIVPRVIVARTGATFDGTTFKDPEERGTKSTLRVKSGQTIVLGGLLREETSDTHTRVPFFSRIPLIGHAFKHKDGSNVQRELVIFITPTILNDEYTLQTRTGRPSQPLVREQDLPGRRERLIEQTLSQYENGAAPL